MSLKVQTSLKCYHYYFIKVNQNNQNFKINNLKNGRQK